MPTTKKIHIDNCPQCGKTHDFQLEIKSFEENKVPLFGGPTEPTPEHVDSKYLTELGFTCPLTQKIFSRTVTINKGETARVVISEPLGQSANKNPEWEKWISDSRSRALSFGTTMLSTSTGAIGVYFAIQKYLGIDEIQSPQLFWYILPPVVYFLASIAFVLCIRPHYAKIREQDFDSFRGQILKSINFYINIGLFLFLTGTLLSIIIFFD